MKWRQKLEGAAIMADENAPYYARARATLAIIEDKRCPTMGVDKHWRMYVNPDFVEEMKPEELAYILIHEVCHLVRNHAGRANLMGITKATHERWNCAGDIEINVPSWGELVRPKIGQFAETYNLPAGKLAEWYYDNLPEQDPKGGKGGKGQGKGQPDGSGSDGIDREWDLAPDDKKAEGLNELDKESIIQQVAQAIQDHEKAGRGSVSAGEKMWSESIVRPKVRWNDQLRHVIAQGSSRIGLGDRTYNRTRIRGGVVMPRHHKIQPNIAIVCDTSGSMGSGANTPYHRALSECIGIAKAAGSVSIIWTDSIPVLQRNIHKLSDCKPVGGGGTDMALGIEFADDLKNGDHPDMIICLTDLETGWPQKPTRSPLVVCAVGRQKDGAPSWAKTIAIDDE